MDPINTGSLKLPSPVVLMAAKKGTGNIFPRPAVGEISPLKYPKFKNLKCRPIPVLTYLQSFRIHWKLLKLDEQCLTHFKYLMHKAEKFNCNSKKWSRTDWALIEKRLSLSPDVQDRKNSDTRLSYYFGNHFFLVKSHFSFGQLFVEEGTVHVYQTVETPLFLYFQRNKERVPSAEKRFCARDVNCYTKRCLFPNSAYKVPEGTTYLILTTAYAFFSVHVANSKTVLKGLNLKDITKEPFITNFVDALYHMPQSTPYVNDIEMEEAPAFQGTPLQESSQETLLQLQESSQETLLQLQESSQESFNASLQTPLPENSQETSLQTPLPESSQESFNASLQTPLPESSQETSLQTPLPEGLQETSLQACFVTPDGFPVEYGSMPLMQMNDGQMITLDVLNYPPTPRTKVAVDREVYQLTQSLEDPQVLPQTIIKVVDLTFPKYYSMLKMKELPKPPPLRKRVEEKEDVIEMGLDLS